MGDTQPIVQKLNQARAALLAVAESVPAECWQKPPRPEAWSTAEVIAHLTMVEQTIVDGAERAVQKEPKPVPVWKRLHIPPVLAEWRFPKARTPIPLDPALVGEKEAMLARFAAVRQRTLAFLDANRQRDLSRWRHSHPFFGSLNMYSWFKTLYHHETRHTKQLREIANSL
ncbi:MAG: DinB family protein [Acidobacteria bacterium]|nr:DinB family protein [Acidobacteriota bacterium]